MRQTREKPREHQQRIAGRQRGGDVAGREGDHEPEQHRLARQPCGQRRDQRSSDDDTEGVGRYDVAGGRDADADARGDLGKQTHGDEFGCANGESTNRERKDREVDVPAGFGRIDIDKIGVLHDGGLSHCPMSQPHQRSPDRRRRIRWTLALEWVPECSEAEGCHAVRGITLRCRPWRTTVYAPGSLACIRRAIGRSGSTGGSAVTCASTRACERRGIPG